MKACKYKLASRERVLHFTAMGQGCSESYATHSNLHGIPARTFHAQVDPTMPPSKEHTRASLYCTAFSTRSPTPKMEMMAEGLCGRHWPGLRLLSGSPWKLPQIRLPFGGSLQYLQDYRIWGFRSGCPNFQILGNYHMHDSECWGGSRGKSSLPTSLAVK